MTDGQFRLHGRMDVALTASVNNWAPAGIANSTSIYIDPDAAWDITGIDAAAYSGGGNAIERVLVLINEDTSFLISLIGLSGLSSAANQFAWSGTITIGRGESVSVKYDRVALLWRLFATGKVTSGGTTLPVDDGTYIVKGSLDATKLGRFEVDTNLAGGANVTLAFPASNGNIATDNNTLTLTNKTLTTPTIGSFTNATHTHADAAGGGQLSATTTFNAGTVPTARLGSGTANSSTYLRGDQTWQTVSAAPAGSDTQVQYNDGGAAAGDADLTWDKTNNQLTATHAKVAGVLSMAGDVAVTLSANPGAGWAPTGHATASALRINPDTQNVSIVGLVAPTGVYADGRILLVSNVGTSGFDVNFIDESGTETTPGNRFALDGNFTLRQDHGALFVYDTVSSRWRCYGHTSVHAHTHTSSVTGGTLDAAAITTGTMATARLGSGTASAYNALIGDQSWGDVTRAILREVTLTDINTSTAESDLFNSTVPANVMSTNRMLRLNIDCDVLNNSGGAETARTLRVYVGGTLRFQDTMTLVGNGTNNQPLNIVVNIGMQNATNTMHMWGVVIMGAGATAPNTGMGDTATDEILVHSAISSNGTFTQDSTATFAVRVTIQHGTSNANVRTRRQYACMEVV